MGKRHPNYRLVKIHRNYKVEEVARLLGKHKNTVLRWIKEGLPIIDDKRPMLILGQDLVAFLKARRKKNKQSCKPGQLYCVRCRLPKYPAGGMVDYEPFTERIGNLIAICPDCDAIMNQRISLARVGEVCGKVDITFPKELRHIVKRVNPSVNSDFRKGS